jgi:hypothetical protein
MYISESFFRDDGPLIQEKAGPEGPAFSVPIQQCELARCSALR